MLEAKYSRLKYWFISVLLLIATAILNTFAKLFERAQQDESSTVLYILVSLFCLLWINTLANRIRDYGSNPWIALFSLIPLVNIVLGLYYGIVKTKNKDSNEKIDSNETSLPKAVYNHTKDVVNEIKPAINQYKEKHSTTKDGNQTIENINSEINEDEIYEKIMIEIEEDKKVKSTWARALSQSDGDDKKANSLYINLRVQEIKIELEKLQKQREIELGNQKLIREENERNKIVEIKKVTAVLEDIQDIQNHGYTFISKNILRKDNSWDDLNLIYDEKLDIYYIKKNEQILDSFYIESQSINN